jgi:hypothetical protein
MLRHSHGRFRRIRSGATNVRNITPERVRVECREGRGLRGSPRSRRSPVYDNSRLAAHGPPPLTGKLGEYVSQSDLRREQITLTKPPETLDRLERAGAPVHSARELQASDDAMQPTYE